MHGFAAWVAILALAIAWAALSRTLALERHDANLEQRLRDLTTRIYAVENYLAPPQPAPPPTPQITPESIPLSTEPPPAPPIPSDIPPTPLPAPTSQDLEAVFGGNWLSKLGVFILLIGLALFLRFSLTAMGPAGRIAVGIATERNPDYRVLGGALIGGAWAALYFTVYSAHALPAARIIDSPVLDFVLLLAFAAGMIAHSLRFDSQTITGLAFAAAFLSIAISPQHQFTRLSSVPLLLTLLAGAGAAYAYFAYALNLATGDGDTNITRFGEPILWTYWLLLEAFDLANLRRHLASPRFRPARPSPALHRGSLLPLFPAPF